MQGQTASAVAFALSGGEPADPRRRLFVDDVPRGGHDHNRRLLVAVEPMEPSRRGLEVATSALEALRNAFAAAAEEAVTLALVRAMAAADAVVEAENRSSPSEERDRRVMIGATAIAVEGNVITLAQLPPSQAMLIQDGLAYSLPSMASWSPTYTPETDQASAEPLGAGAGVAPLLYRSAISPGDLILLCDSALVRCLDESERSMQDGSRTKLRSLDEALTWLEGVAARNDLEDAQAACIAIPSSHDPGQPYAHLTSKQRRPRWLKVANRHHRHSLASVVEPNPEIDPASDWSAGPSTSESAAGGTLAGNDAIEEEEHSPRTATPSLESTAATSTDPATTPFIEAEPLEEPQSVAEPEPVAATEPATVPDQLDDTLPLPTMEPAAPARSPVPPQPWWQVAGRQRLHRVGPRRYLVAALMALLTICGTSGLWYGQHVAHAEREESLATAIASVDATLNSAAQGRASARDLAAAAAALEQAAGLGAPAAVVEDRSTALSSYEDALQGVVRLGGLSRIGGLPPELAADAPGPPRLIRANRDLYLVAGGLYRLDLAQNRLISALAPGSEIGDQEVGSLITGAWAPGGLSVSDGEAVYTIDASDSWSVQPLGAPPTATWNDAACAMLNGAFYVLDDTTGQIRKYDLAKQSASGETWLPAAEGAALRNARGMVIDGDVHILLADGQIATLSNGAVSSIHAIEVEPALSDPIALAGGMDASALWILDQANGEPRLTRVDPGGGEAKSFRLAMPGGVTADATFATLHDLAVDEVDRIVYFLTDTEIWRADLPVFIPVD